MWSILLYAFSAIAAGFATSVGWLLFFRCTTFVGVCVEFVAAVAWLAELFPDPKRREAVLGWTQAFSSVGGLMVTGAYFLAVHYAESLPAIHGRHAPWRYTLISGVIPALPLIGHPPLPAGVAGLAGEEGSRDAQAPEPRRDLPGRPQEGHPRHDPPLRVQLRRRLRRDPARAPHRARPRRGERASPRPDQQKVVSGVQALQEFGGLAGRVILAFLAVRIVSRRRLLRVFQVPGLVLVPVVFVWAAVTDLDALKWGIFLVGLLTVAQFSFWGNYLPRMYPTHLRGTGESFAANVGGRMIGTSAAFVTTTLATSMPGGTPSVKLAWAAALVGFAVYAVGVVASFFLPGAEGRRSCRTEAAGVFGGRCE